MSAQISVPASATPGGSCSTSHALAALQVCAAGGGGGGGVGGVGFVLLLAG